MASDHVRVVAVDHPAHYGGADNPYETIRVIEAWGLDFHLGNAVKYLSRAGKKGDELEDLQKARWYLNRRIELLERAAQIPPIPALIFANPEKDRELLCDKSVVPTTRPGDHSERETSLSGGEEEKPELHRNPRTGLDAGGTPWPTGPYADSDAAY